jgi:Domain of unknown function (DUF4388)
VHRESVDAQLPDGAHFAGSIAELPVADLIQMLLLAGKPAVITVARNGMESHVWCAAGELVDAESGLLKGPAALYRVLGFEQGSLVAALRTVSRQRTIAGNPTRLLLEGARRKDESDAIRSKLGGEQRRYRHAQTAPEPTALRTVELALLCSLATARSVADVVASSGQGELETLTLLARWIDAGVLVDAGQQATPTLAALEASIAPRSAAGGQALAARWSSSWAATLHQVRQFWGWGVLATVVLVPGAYLLGANSAHTLARRAPSAEEPSAVRAVVEALPPSYPVEIQVEPADAQIALDGAQPVVGHLETHLLRNGLVHELRVTAPGFIPSSSRFVDAAPPTQLRLDPLSLPDVVCGSPVSPASSDEEEGANTKLSRRAGGAHDAARRERRTETGSARPQTRGPGPLLNKPQIQVLDRQEPVIDVIN